METGSKFKTVEEYLSQLPPPAKKAAETLRQAIRKAAPQAEEVISYNMPAYKQKGILVYFAVWKHHIGFYPTGSGIRAFQKEIESYKSAKGSVQFPLDQPMPLDLVKRIVKHRVAENEQKAALKAAKPKRSPAST
ncbi:MAG: hypothetical protein JWP88_1182 [Flaviaesturariibacter sp.]|nr:hypothetical protein [Flaviaesturariibacter sp.]